MKLADLFEMSMQDLRTAEDLIERMFKDLELDVIWTTHFKERIVGREENVSLPELVDAFRRMKQKYGPALQASKDNHERFEAVLKDLAHDLNIPFAIDFSHKDPRSRKYNLRGITIMRKDPSRFHINAAGGKELTIEGVKRVGRHK